MNQTTASPCIENGIDPLLAELREAVELFHAAPGGTDRQRLLAFVREVFRHAHGAEVAAVHPNLLGFSSGAALRAVLGYRSGNAEPLFSEQYLEGPADRLIAARFGQPVRRDELVEVGNFALADPGQARWVIAATTTYLAAAGYRWVMFTATRPLANA
ncbi:MAG: thermostable hemolysin, partial [Gallionellaceae bacterium]|nr:thermostable hemolysin [Gallionellaceae bacterium]